MESVVLFIIRSLSVTVGNAEVTVAEHRYSPVSFIVNGENINDISMSSETSVSNVSILSESEVSGPEKLLSTSKAVSTPVLFGDTTHVREKDVPS